MRALPILAVVLLIVASVLAAGNASSDEEALGPGDTFRDCEKCPEMVVIPAGRFVMGAPDSDTERQANEGPQHEVTIPAAFAVGKFEVTRGEFAAFVEDRQWETRDACSTYEDGSLGSTARANVARPGLPAGCDPPGRLRDLRRRSRLRRMAIEEDRRGIPPSDRGRVGICRQGRSNNALLLWRRQGRALRLCKRRGPIGEGALSRLDLGQQLRRRPSIHGAGRDLQGQCLRAS